MVGVLAASAVIYCIFMSAHFRESSPSSSSHKHAVVSHVASAKYFRNNDTVVRIDPLDGNGPCNESKAKSPSPLGSGVFNITDVKSWSTFHVERTQFTHHVLGLIRHRSESVTYTTTTTNNNNNGTSVVDSTNELFKKCNEVVRFHVSKPYRIPTVTHDENDRNSYRYYEVMRRIFSNQVLPYNVTTGFSYADYSHRDIWTYPCFSNSDANGQFSVPNMEDVLKMGSAHGLRGEGPDSYRWAFDDEIEIPWHDRQTIPVFRGRLWIYEGGYKVRNATMLSRWKAVLLSLHRPDLLNARYSHVAPDVPVQEQLLPTIQNETMREQILNFDQIPEKEYFRKNQVALVLTGIGAAFRVSTHLMTRTAVILQQCDMQEWYTKYLRPYVHFIPLKNDLSDLMEVLLWVKDYPDQVRTIAEQGRMFWEQFLSFDRHEQHFYELVYRMSEYEHWRSLVGVDGEVIWDESSNPWPELEMHETAFDVDEEVPKSDALRGEQLAVGN